MNAADRDLVDLFDDRLARIPVPPRRLRPRARPRRVRALAMAAVIGLLLAASATTLEANAFAEAQAARCVDLGKKMKAYLGAAQIVQSEHPVYPNLPPGSTVVVTAPDGHKESIKTSPSGANAEAAPGSVLATGEPTATCTVGDVTIQVFDSGDTGIWMAIRRLMPGQ
ncbi:MAG: hypothetical protein KGJ98_12605 [Chloroflexota bacterium]|nr:hypothetical protein [Chloroflexota bacterium]